ncbi:MAG: hypothetical protein MUE40_13740 [Anaerolineae bacterium]|jgi:hypothetical protein|nr:hypothetical protein [Anaerolineae bacterium]
MPITIDWYNPEKTLIVLRVEETWNWQDLLNAIDAQNALTDSVPHVVDVITDATRSQPMLPPAALSSFRSVVQRLKPAPGLRVIVGLPPYFRLMLNMAIKLHPVIRDRYHFAATLADALHLVGQAQGRRGA